MNRSRVLAGWQHHAMSDCVVQSGGIVDNRWLPNEWYDVPATEYIPAGVLAKFGPDGKK
jgi:hypothetical protein